MVYLAVNGTVIVWFVTNPGYRSRLKLDNFERVLGKKSEALDLDWLRNYSANFDEVALDIGTGDGRFVVDRALAEPKRLWIGLDPVAENMAKLARTVLASPKKGGLANVLFLRASAQQLPGPLEGIVDQISVNYPWGSLLRIVTLPHVDSLKRIIACSRPGKRLEIYLNYSIFEDPPYLARLGLADIPDPATGSQILDGYVAAGCTVPSRRLFTGDPPFRTQWARHLVRGSDRKSLFLETSIAGG